MTTRQPIIFAASLTMMAIAAAAMLVGEAGLRQRRDERSEEFQRLVGGLGFGPALDLSGCPFLFDPRLADDCAAEEGQLAGGGRFGPHHAGSIFYYPPLAPRQAPMTSRD